MVIWVEAATFDAVLPLRAEVLRDGRPMDAAHFDGDHDETTRHLAAISDEEGFDAVVGCVSLMVRPMPGDDAWTHQLRGMAVAETHRNQGIGAMLLAAVARRMPHEALWCNARVPAQRFYERHGWTAVGGVFDVPHHGPHVRMRRVATC
ncbi:MAG: GNAT family N-acetyltransferase [Planctomycetota bacterium]